MGLETQKWLRLLIPGLFLYGLLVILCFTTEWCELAIPKTLEEASKLLAAIVLGAIYSVTGLRELSNKHYFFDVNENIRGNLIRPFVGQIVHVDAISWRDVRSVFYHFVDLDESLKIKSSIVRFNGLLWTSIADLRAICVIGILAFSSSVICSHYVTFGVISPFPEYRAGFPILALTILFLATFHFSQFVTQKHKQLGDEQCEYILNHFRDELRSKLSELASQGC